ncbi:hypothetical protein [Mucilaginibacter sp. OK283]|uniref:hypothetical protein n=1 Tax=Mucilaginibacter sp. OK283 TaxID=1881049 RepID=UPI0015A70E03|nr:hypothetical protein [Mucilaginibacter sp. OK283]
MMDFPTQPPPKTAHTQTPVPGRCILAASRVTDSGLMMADKELMRCRQGYPIPLCYSED